MLIGRILSFATIGKPGLGYCRDGYFSLNQERSSEASAAGNMQTIAAALVEHQGKLCVLKSDEGFHLPTVQAADRSGARTAMTQHLTDLQINAELGPAYSVFDDADNASHVTVFRARLKGLPAIDGQEWWPIADPGLTRLLPPANQQMMRRFQHEYRNNQFGLYIGDAVRGEVHHPVSTTA